MNLSIFTIWNNCIFEDTLSFKHIYYMYIMTCSQLWNSSPFSSQQLKVNNWCHMSVSVNGKKAGHCSKPIGVIFFVDLMSSHYQGWSQHPNEFGVQKSKCLLDPFVNPLKNEYPTISCSYFGHLSFGKFLLKQFSYN